ncbi:hypothetical protein [Haloferula sp.]|uniref:hypothetical protein n=1 Tax=Haloferula sp. TaxID=2497595 RepID=UPI00329AEB43
MPKLVLIAWLAITAPLAAQAVLKPPFGLKWGDSPEKLIDWAARHALDVEITLPGKEPDLRIFKIQAAKGPLPDSKARSVESRFHSGRLYEVTVHYGGSAESPELVDRHFNELKRRLSVEHGTFKANQQEQTVENQFATRTLSFHREPVKGLYVNIAFTEMEDRLRETREAAFSLVYRNDNLLQQLEAAAAAEAVDPGGR